MIDISLEIIKKIVFMLVEVSFGICLSCEYPLRRVTGMTEKNMSTSHRVYAVDTVAQVLQFVICLS